MKNVSSTKKLTSGWGLGKARIVHRREGERHPQYLLVRLENTLTETNTLMDLIHLIQRS